MKLYTIGYALWTLRQVVRLIRRLDAILVDVRFSRRTRKREFTPKALGGALGGRYVWAGDLGNVNYKGGRIRIKNLSAGLGQLAELSSGGKPLVLMCVCADVAVCHRKVVAEKAKARLGAEVEHLGPPKRPKQGKLF